MHDYIAFSILIKDFNNLVQQADLSQEFYATQKGQKFSVLWEWDKNYTMFILHTV